MSRNTLRAALVALLALILCLSCACAPEFVGEERAKSAGLALLQQAFAVNLRDAHVEYFERAGTSVVDNTEVNAHSGTPNQIYLVTISDQTMGADLYYCEVDAKTGVAYYASKSEWLLSPLANDPQQTTENTDHQNETEAEAALQDCSAEDAACEFVMRRFQKEVALISGQGCCNRDTIFPPRAGIGYFVTFADGSIYRVGFSWPNLELEEVQLLENEPKGEQP